MGTPSNSINIPPVPAETAIAASYVLGPTHPYRAIGDHLEQVIFHPALEKLWNCGMQESVPGYLLALMTIIQWMEGLTDRQIAAAIQTRIDLKFALHVPLISPALDPQCLCIFRQHLLADASLAAALQTLIELLAQGGLTKAGDSGPAKVCEVWRSVCLRNRLSWIWDSMNEALEVLASTQYEWLRQVALAHWYKRYQPASPNRRGWLDVESFASQADSIGMDINYLLGEINAAPDARIAAMAEVGSLGKSLAKQYTHQNCQLRFRVDRCENCGGNLS